MFKDEKTRTDKGKARGPRSTKYYSFYCVCGKWVDVGEGEKRVLKEAGLCEECFEKEVVKV